MMSRSDPKSVCQKCKALCCRLVTPPVTEKEKQRILKAGFPDYFEKIDTDLYKIKSQDKKPCPYLKKDYSCSIHNVKPMLCALWPVVPQYKNKKRGCLIIKCPLYPYLPKEFIEGSIKEAEKIPLHIIEELWNLSPEMKEKYKRFEYQKI
jgi:Fe-S-cluster containining protein